MAERVIQGLQGHYVELAADTTGCGFKLVRACLATPCGMLFGHLCELYLVHEMYLGRANRRQVLANEHFPWRGAFVVLNK